MIDSRRDDAHPASSHILRFDAIDHGVYPPAVHPPYRSTLTRGPQHAAVRISAPAATAPLAPWRTELIGPHDLDLTAHGPGAPLGEKIVVAGRVTDEDGRPVRRALVEVWQCNAAGRYRHARDRHDAPLDPNFHGIGKFLTDDEGRYRFVTIKPGPYPWGNHDKAWRPAHIHFSLFGNVYAQRLVTQMYWAHDPLLAHDPIYCSIPDEAARERLWAHLDMGLTVGAQMLGYRFDITLRGRAATPFGL